jgi:hypothetical protein
MRLKHQQARKAAHPINVREAFHFADLTVQFTVFSSKSFYNGGSVV